MPGTKLQERKDIKVVLRELETDGGIGLSVDCIIFGFDDNELKVLMIRSDMEEYYNKWSLLGDLVHHNEDLTGAAYRILKERTGMADVYLEQMQTFGNVDRHLAARVVTTAYCSLIDIKAHELAITDHELTWHKVDLEMEMAFDHQRILRAAHEWLQKRVQEHPLGFNLLPQKFSLRQLQQLYESILQLKLDRRNFRKKFFSMGLLDDTNEVEENVPHRPGKLYTFNYEKYRLKERRKFMGIDF